MNTRNLRSLLVTGAAIAWAGTATATVLDFEGFGAGQIIDNEYDGVTISGVTNLAASPDVAIIFDTDNIVNGIDADLGAPFIGHVIELPGDNQPIALTSVETSFEDFYPGNVLILQENEPCNQDFCDVPDDAAAGGMFTFEWDTPVNLESIDFFDIERHEAGAPIEAWRIAMFNGNGEELAGNWLVPETGGDNTWARLMLDATNVSRLEITLAGSGAIDNITFTRVPLPGVAWLFFPGLAMLGLKLRRR